MAGTSFLITQGTQTSIAADNYGAFGTWFQVIRQDFVPSTLGTSYGTVGTAGAGFWGTIIAACGAGTKQYVSGVDIVGVTGSCEVAITNIGIGGSQGAGVLARGWIVPGGGISKNFMPIQASGTNGTVSYWLSTAGTVDITLQYWQGV